MLVKITNHNEANNNNNNHHLNIHIYMHSYAKLFVKNITNPLKIFLFICSMYIWMFMYHCSYKNVYRFSIYVF